MLWDFCSDVVGDVCECFVYVAIHDHHSVYWWSALLDGAVMESFRRGVLISLSIVFLIASFVMPFTLTAIYESSWPLWLWFITVPLAGGFFSWVLDRV